MEQRLANTWRMTINEKKFTETALLSGLRTDGRNLYDYRKLTINFGREDGSSEVQLGQTRVLGFVTSQLVQPYRDRPTEGTLSIFTEFSPMADPSFEPGRPGESAVELGRVIDRGLRESRAVDTESLCVLAGKLVWAIRIDLHILDNGGNLVDAANIAALAALSTFRRPECSVGGEDGKEVIVHPPEAREPLPLTIHHFPVAVTFAFLSNESIVVLDPTHHEEAVMGGRMTATLNTNGDICAIQKAGGEGVPQSVIMQCLRIATTKATDITSKIKDAVEAYNTERGLQKIKRHSVPTVSEAAAKVKGNKSLPLNEDGDNLSGNQLPEISQLKIQYKENNPHQSDSVGGNMGMGSPAKAGITCRGANTKNFFGGPSSWDPYSKGVDPDFLRSSLASRGVSMPTKKPEDSRKKKHITSEAKAEVPPTDSNPASSIVNNSKGGPPASTANRERTLKDAVKPKHKRKKRGSISIEES